MLGSIAMSYSKSIERFAICGNRFGRPDKLYATGFLWLGFDPAVFLVADKLFLLGEFPACDFALRYVLHLSRPMCERTMSSA